MSSLSPRVALVAVLPLLGACLVWRDGGPGRGPRGDRPPRIDEESDTADTGAVDTDDSAADSGDTSPPDSGSDSGGDTADGRDTADSGGTDTGSVEPDPARWTLSDECDGAPLTFVDARVNVDPDAVLPGARVALVVTMHNPTAVDDLAYPGVLFSSSSADQSSSGHNYLYGLFAGSSSELGTVFEVAPTAAPGAVELRATVTRLGCDSAGDCPVACTLTYPVTVLAP
jgi:hypothetical protein